MRFSRYLQFNQVPEWSEYYVQYSQLKTLIYEIEKEKLSTANERTTLLPSQENGIILFTQALERSLYKIIQFYTERESEANVEVDHILAPSHSACSTTNDKTPCNSSYNGTPSTPVIIVIDDGYLSVPSSSTADRTLGNISSSTSMTMVLQNKDNSVAAIEKDRHLSEIYIYLTKLKSFILLNLKVFTKILKKYDKLMKTKQSQKYMSEHVLKAYPFLQQTRRHLDGLILQVEQAYQGKIDLSLLLKEKVNCDRNAIWREKIGQERKPNNIVLQQETSVDDEEPKRTQSISRASICIAIFSILLFIYLLNSSLFHHVEQRRCFAVLVFASSLWATELMPLFVTALLVPFLVIVLKVIRSEEELDNGTIVYTRLSATDASKAVFASMLSPVIMLLLGGFSIAAALNKYGIAKSLASFILSKAGTRPSNVLLANMLVASLASMWISNVAAPVLCTSLIQPILHNLPANSPFGPCLIMGIALASNLGGIASPIASPQNVIAIQNMTPPPSWTDWFCISIPLCLLGNFIVWIWLLKSYRITDQHISSSADSLEIYTSHQRRKISSAQIYVGCVTIFTILLWCIARTYKDTLGDMGVIAIIPLIAFFGTGILTKDEFNSFLWNVIILAMGGIALGKAVESSGLLHTIAVSISKHVMGLTTFQVLVVFCALVLLIATFISHTVAALIVLPIVAKIGAHLSDPNPRLLVMGTAFVCSAAMGLPVSGFPNMTAISQENVLGMPYLKTADFIRNGVPCSILIMLCIVTLGYVLMELTGI